MNYICYKVSSTQKFCTADPKNWAELAEALEEPQFLDFNPNSSTLNEEMADELKAFL